MQNSLIWYLTSSYLKAAYFDRDDIALPGFAKRFQANSEEEREHAMKLINYQNMRGGRVVFQDIAKAKTDDWYSALSAVEASLELEKKVHEVTEPIV